MTDRKQNVLVGLFVLAGLMCLATLIVLFGESRALFGQRYQITARFDRVEGVREGTDVNLAGVWVGSVLKVMLADPTQPHEGVHAILDIDPKYSVPQGSIAVVLTPLMGQPIINIIPPPVAAALLPQDGTAAIRGEVKNPLEQVIDPGLMATLEKTTFKIGELAGALTPAAQALEKLLEQRSIEQVDRPALAPEAVTANLSTAVERLDNVLKHIGTVLGDPEVQSNLKQTLANFKAASEEAKLAVTGLNAFAEQAQKTMVSAHGVVEKVDATVVSAHEHIDALGMRLRTNTEQLSRVLDHMTAVGQQMAEGEGTVGMLLRDPKFYDELMLTVQRLGSAAGELEVLIKQWQKQGLLGAAR